MARQKTLAIILEEAQGKDFTSGDQILCSWRIRGQIMASSLSSRTVWNLPDGRGTSQPVLGLRFYVYWDRRTAEYVLCGAIRGQENEQLKRSEVEWKTPGVPNHESEERGSGDWSSETSEPIGK